MSFRLLVSLFILFAAFGSSVWNLYVKKSSHGLVFVTLMLLPQLSVAIPLAAISPPPSIITWYYLLLSSLVHTAYIVFLAYAYFYGKLNRVFPLAIGTSTLLALVFWHAYLKDPLTSHEYWGVVLTSIGIMSLAFFGGRKDKEKISIKSIICVLATSIFIVCYTSIDSKAVRITPDPLTFISWLFIVKGLMLLIPVVIIQKIKFKTLVESPNYIVAGLLAGLGYTVAVYSFIYFPTSVVLSLRSTSILFVFILSVLNLKEEHSPILFGALLAIVAGVSLLLTV